MAERGALEAAAAAGVIRAEQVGPLHDFLASRAAGVSAASNGEEDLRFIRNFHDVFLATASCCSLSGSLLAFPSM